MAIAQPHDNSLALGERAPSLHVARWLKGVPIEKFSIGKTYVVEFGGTWCPPCRKALPHFNDLSWKYRDKVSFVSVFLENNNKQDSSDLKYIDGVAYFFEEMGLDVGFSVAVDVPQQTTKHLWKAFSLPLVYVVDRSGAIAWKGRPEELDRILDAIVRDTDFRDLAIEMETGRIEMQRFIVHIDSLAKLGSTDRAVSLIDRLLTTASETDANQLSWVKFDVLAAQDTRSAYEWLSQLLQRPLSGFNWTGFVGSAFNKIQKIERQYVIELEAIDRAIREAETPYLRAYPLSVKARTFALMGHYGCAVEAMEAAIAVVGNRDPVDADLLRDLTNQLARYRNSITMTPTDM